MYISTHKEQIFIDKVFYNAEVFHKFSRNDVTSHILLFELDVGSKIFF